MTEMLLRTVLGQLGCVGADVHPAAVQEIHDALAVAVELARGGRRALLLALLLRLLVLLLLRAGFDWRLSPGVRPTLHKNYNQSLMIRRVE